jgi:hypothetical protein
MRREIRKIRLRRRQTMFNNNNNNNNNSNSNSSSSSSSRRRRATTHQEGGFELPELGDFSLFMSPFYSPSGQHQRSRRRNGVPFTPISNSWDDGGFGDLTSHPMFADQEDDLLPKASEFGTEMSALDKLTPELVQNTAANGAAVTLDTPRPLDEFTSAPVSPTSAAGKRKRAGEF